MLADAVFMLLVFFDTLIRITGSCGGGATSLYYSGRFELSSYNNGMRCSWRLNSRQGERVFLTFRSFSTEPRWDYVEIRDTMNTSHVIGHFSGSQIPPVVVSCGSSLNVTFVSDGSVTMDGFAASFESRRDITSNKFPNDYANGEEQQWVVCAFQNNPLCMRFTTFDTEQSFDFVDIATSSRSFIGKYSGSSLPPTLHTSLNTLVNFTSDGSNTAKGFRAEFCPSTCPVLNSPVGGHFDSSLHTVNTRVQLLCHPGYKEVGTSSVTCQASGTWSDTIGYCQRFSCPPPPDVANGVFVGASYYMGEEVRMQCNDGYYVAGGRNRFRCSTAGVWNDKTRMVCYAVSCGKPTAPQNGEVTGEYYFDNAVRFTCKSGYRLQGPSSATCLASGKWNQHPPTCQDTSEFLSEEEKTLIHNFQDNFFEPYATYTKEAMPPPGSVLRSATHPDDSILALDLIFVLDTSGSVGSQHFESVKMFVKRMAHAFNMGKDSTHMGALAFGTIVYDISSLTSSYDDFRNAVIQFQYQSGWTNTTGALLEAQNMFLSNKRNQARLKRVLILVTDGRSNTHRIQPSATVPDLARNSIERFVFGVTNHVNNYELQAIASPPHERHVFHVSSFTAFKNFAEFLRPKKITSVCGIAGAPGFHARVLNGKRSSYGAWPWLASIYIKGPQQKDQFELSCGGTLVNKRWVITAAHCVYDYQFNKKRIRVKLGDYFRHVKDPDEETFQLDDSEDITFGGSGTDMYNPWTYDNDIAMMKLNREVIFNSFIRPICLLQPLHHNVILTNPGSVATVVGWGIHTVGGKTLSLSPLETTVAIHRNSRCNQANSGRSLTDKMICARGKNSDACPGDSGSPLMCQSNDNRFSLCGIVSFGRNATCSVGYGVYTKTFNFLNTIKSKIADTR